MQLPDIATDDRRLVRLDAVHNFRDLGGYPTADGHTTRWRRLFRADGLHRLAGEDLETVRELGLRTVIDLRTDAELEERGTFPVEEHDVDFHHVAIIDRTWDPAELVDDPDPADFLERAYLKMLEEGERRLAEAYVKLAAPGALPAVFHCAAGKDRTGLLAMLVLGSLHVPDEYIIADYALSEEGMQRMIAWAERTYPEMYERMKSGPSIFSAARPEAMRRMLAHVREWHGSIEGFLLAMGVPEVAIDRLRSELLD